MLYLYDCLRCLFTHVLNGILVSKPIGALNGVEEMILPAVLFNIAQSSIDTTLKYQSYSFFRKYIDMHMFLRIVINKCFQVTK